MPCLAGGNDLFWLVYNMSAVTVSTGCVLALGIGSHRNETTLVTLEQKDDNWVLQVQPADVRRTGASLVQDVPSEELAVSVARRSLAEHSTPFTRQLPVKPFVAGVVSP